MKGDCHRVYWQKKQKNEDAGYLLYKGTGQHTGEQELKFICNSNTGVMEANLGDELT